MTHRYLVTKMPRLCIKKRVVMIRKNELMNVRCSERGSLLGIKIYSPSSECLVECVDIPEHKMLILVSECNVRDMESPHMSLYRVLNINEL